MKKRREFDRELFLESLHPELRKMLEREVEPTRHAFTVRPIGGANTPQRRVPERRAS